MCACYFINLIKVSIFDDDDGGDDDDGDGDDDVDGDGGDATCPLASSASDPSTVLGPLRRESAGSIPKYTEYTRIYRVYWGIQRVPGSEFEEGASSQTAHLPLNSLQPNPRLCFNMISRNVRKDTFSPTRIYFLQLVPTRPAGANCWEVIAKLSLASTSSRCVITMHIAQFPLCTMHFEICSYFNQE